MSQFVQLKINVSAFIEPVVRDFVVCAAVFQAVLLFFFATIYILQLSSKKENSFLDFFWKFH